MVERLDKLEERITQLEVLLKEPVLFEGLSPRLTNKKTKRTRAKREGTQEEKDAFHKRMLEAKKAKDKARQGAAMAEAAKK